MRFNSGRSVTHSGRPLIPQPMVSQFWVLAAELFSRIERSPLFGKVFNPEEMRSTLSISLWESTRQSPTVFERNLQVLLPEDSGEVKLRFLSPPRKKGLSGISNSV